MDSEFLRVLRLRPETLLRDLEVSNGLAMAYRQNAEGERGNEPHALSAAATLYRRAAADALLLGRYIDAKGLFHEASLTYQSLGLPYSVIVASLSSKGHRMIGHLTARWLDAYADHAIAERAIPQLAYVILARLVFDESQQMPFDRLKNVRTNLEPYRMRSLGVLGFSVGTLLALFDALDPTLRVTRVDITEAIAPLLDMYNSAIRQTMANHYHSERLSLPFHHAEPDVYGILTLTDSVLQIRRGVTVQRFIERAAISNESKYLLNTILEGMIDNQ